MLPVETQFLYKKLGEEYIEELIREHFEATGEEISSIKVEITDITFSIGPTAPIETLNFTINIGELSNDDTEKTT